MTEYAEKLTAMKAHHEQLRREDHSPRGQSGSALDYKLDAELGQFMCENEGHRMNTPKTFCSRCGRYFIDDKIVSYPEFMGRAPADL